MIKSQLLAITYAAIAKQVYKQAKSYAEANQKLQKIGEQIGLRVADQFNDKEAGSVKIQEKVVSFLKGVTLEYMGCEIELLNTEVIYGKNRMTIILKYVIKDNPLSDFVIMPKSIAQKQNSDEQFNYHAILFGFISGCFLSMAFNPTVKMEKDSLREIPQTSEKEINLSLFAKAETIFNVELWKQKEED